MSPRLANRLLLMVVAVLGWLGVVLQQWVAAQAAMRAGHSALRGILDALCYFTVLTNLALALVVSASLAGVRWALLTSRATLAAVAVYIFVVGMIYSLLLRALWAPSGLHKIADALLHDLVPLCYLVWWLCFAPKDGLKWSQPFKWLLWPLAYFVFLVLRGQATGRYLYPFADIAKLGLPTVLRNALLLLALFWILGLIAVAVGRRSTVPQN
jgi:hypothetical protein